jgi:hypothetical protein
MQQPLASAVDRAVRRTAEFTGLPACGQAEYGLPSTVFTVLQLRAAYTGSKLAGSGDPRRLHQVIT